MIFKRYLKNPYGNMRKNISPVFKNFYLNLITVMGELTGATFEKRSIIE
jgi:hypothetical protein